MGNTNPLPNINLSFLLGWVLANIVGLPALFLPYLISFFLLGSFAIIGDGMPIGPMGYALIFIILALSGAMIGAWLGFMQSLPLKAQVVQSGKWIGASSVGVAIGAPLSWLAHSWFLESPIVNRPDGIHSIYFSFGYAYLIFGVLLGLTIGVAQWSVLRQQVDGAGWWMIVLPLCFTVGVLFTNFYISNTQVSDFFAMFSPLTALVGVGCITGILLRWLLQFPKTQREAQEMAANNPCTRPRKSIGDRQAVFWTQVGSVNAALSRPARQRVSHKSHIERAAPLGALHNKRST